MIIFYNNDGEMRKWYPDDRVDYDSPIMSNVRYQDE